MDKFLKYITIAGNIIYVLWILYNGFHEGFTANLVQIISCTGLILLLILNSILIYRRR
jgi:hypothetical protein